jgi:anaerobic selenocysteine-containing dehydrogenase
MLFGMKQKRGVAETMRVMDGVDAAIEALRGQDPEASDEILGYELLQRGVAAGTASPPAFFHFYHCGYKETWNREEWSDPAMGRPFEDFVADATRRGWWGGLVKPGPSTDPQVLFIVATNPIRRQRGGADTLLQTLWPRLEKVVVVENRMSATALQADILLPAAMQYERPNLQYAITHSFHVGFSEQATPPRGEAKTEWEIFKALSRKVQERAVEQGVTEYLDGRRQPRAWTRSATPSAAGAYKTKRLSRRVAPGTASRRERCPTTGRWIAAEKGTVRFQASGCSHRGCRSQPTSSPNETITAFQWHVEDGVPFPTLTRRAQFLIDHPWFAEAGEDLPCHKENPFMGGRYPFLVTSGHSRWTVHAASMGNSILSGTHRGEPLAIIGLADAGARGICDGDLVEVRNDRGSYRVRARTSPRVRPGQLIVYNGWEPHMFPGWKGANEVEPGMVKWLHFVSRYGHLRYLPFGWQPVPADRAVYVEVCKV